jgi:hypothetical protein
MRPFNQLLAQVRENRNKQYSKNIEDATYKTLAERYKTIMVATRKNGCEHCRHCMSDNLEEEDKEDDDDSSVFPEDELILLVNSVEFEGV